MEFNSINFKINNFATQKAGIVQNNTQGQNQPQTQSQQLPAQTFQNQNINPALMYDFQMAKMDNETVLKYLQNMLKLPNSIEKFVNQLNSKNVDPKLASILLENLISTKALAEFLNQNSTDAISKLMQTISASLKQGNNDVSQLKEILNVLSVIQNSSALNINTVKELLLLYIPLNQPVFDKEIVQNELSEDEKNNIKQSKLSILFETINFSNMLCCINEQENTLFLDLFCSKGFAKDKFNSVVLELSKEAGINSLIEFKEKQDILLKNVIQNFKIISDGFISPNSLILAHIVIKTILKIDNDFKN